MRLFIALDLPREVKAALGACAAGLAGATGGRPAREENFHLTLAFLGELPAGRIPAVRRCMAEAAGGEVRLNSGGLGRFRARGGATLWLGVEKTPELCALHERLCRALRDRGFALEEREFRPHITLVREAARPAPETAAPEFALAVREAVLMESVRERGQLCYRPRYVQPL